MCKTAYGNLAPHTPYADDGDCTTDILCSVCKTVTSAGKEAHSGGIATCLKLAKCSICDNEYGNLATHTDGDYDEKCDICSIELSIGKSGITVGGIIAIIICSVVVAGGSGFAIAWFVIKKKT